MNAHRMLKEKLQIKATRLHYIAADPAEEIGLINPDCFDPKELPLEGDTVILPPAAVAAIVLETE